MLSLRPQAALWGDALLGCFCVVVCICILPSTIYHDVSWRMLVVDYVRWHLPLECAVARCGMLNVVCICILPSTIYQLGKV